jgi:hypothetical protein
MHPIHIAAAHPDGGNASNSMIPAPDPSDSVEITEQEVGEYREQDRFLPVRSAFALLFCINLR